MSPAQPDPGADVAARVREARRGAGLTQGELAALVGVARTTVSRWERGETTPSRGQLSGIALHCGTDALELQGSEATVRTAMSGQERMRAALGVIARYVAEHGYPPSMQEIMDETGFSSKSVVKSWLDRCEVAGLIVRRRHTARAVALTEEGRAFAEAPSETGGLPVRRDETAPGVPRTAAPPAPTDTPPPPALLRPGAARPVERTPAARRSDPEDGMGARIREARRAESLTQAELAALVGVSPHTVWCWEAGRTKPTHERRVAIAFHCGTDLAALEGRTASRRERLEAIVAVFRDAVAHLPEEDIRFIWTFIRFKRWRRRRRGRAA